MFVEEVRPEDWGMASPNNYGGYRIEGRILNKSKKYKVVGLDVSFRLYDCVLLVDGKEERCTIVAEADKYLGLDIPSGQARDFSDVDVDFYPAPKFKGRWRWDYKIESVTSGI
ncbi:hypothetical protein N5K55_05770 [Pseudomonas aeruginosa]|nr:hypothetical protein [Pseudomonas aeruginosa]